MSDRMQAFNWSILKSKYIIKDDWISLRADTCQMPDGHVIDPYYVFEYPPWVNVVAFTDKDEIILVRQYRHGVRKTLLELPCGCMDEKDSSPLEAIKRELSEETGYASDNFVETGRLSANPANHNNTTYCYLATDAKPVTKQKLDRTEQIEIVLMPLNRVLELIGAGEIFQALHVSSIFLAMKKLGKVP